MNKPFSIPGTTYPMRATSVNFTNGMIVTDRDLMAAMHYPVQLMQMVNRGVYGCGVACGFKFEPDPGLCGRPHDCDPCSDKDPRKAFGFMVQIGRGTAIDCFGMPIELCEPVLVDVTPDKCGCEQSDTEVCIAVRRTQSYEAARGDCCGDTPPECSRVQDHVEFRAFPKNKLPDHICMHAPDKRRGDCGCGQSTPEPDDSTVPAGSAPRERDAREIQLDICKCLATCDPCDCCGDGWVLLGCVTLCKAGVLEENFRTADGKPSFAPYASRKMIKTIECFCREPWGRDARDQISEDQQAQFMTAVQQDLGITNERNLEIVSALNISNFQQLNTFLTDDREKAMKLFGFQKPGRIDDIVANIEKILKDKES